MSKEKRIPLGQIVLSAALLLFHISLFSGNPSLMIRLGHEDGIIESLGAACFLAAAVLFFVRYLLKSDGLQLRYLKTKRNPIVLALAVVLFIFAGEEISWGQRVFHFKTPEFLARMNYQRETNVHNLNILSGRYAEGQGKWSPFVVNSSRLFVLFAAGFLLFIPLLARNKRISGWAARLNIPIAPLYIGIFFCLSFGITRFMRDYLERTYPGYPKILNMANEARESFFAFLFLVVAWILLKQARKDAGRPKASNF